MADVLIAMSGIFESFLKKNGILIMSGIILPRKDVVVDAVEKNGFSLLETHEKDGWVALAVVLK